MSTYTGVTNFKKNSPVFMAHPVDERVKAISDHNQDCHHYHFTIVNILYTD